MNTVYVYKAALLVSISAASLSVHAAGLTTEEALGKRLYKDETLSLNNNQSCATCHSLTRSLNENGKKMQAPGFVDPMNTRLLFPVSLGSDSTKNGALNSPSAGYAAFSPKFHWDSAEGLYIGGQFWDGRAPLLADQAEGPFLNPVEMAMPSKWAVIDRLKQNKFYRNKFKKLYSVNLGNVPDEGTTAEPYEVAYAYGKMAHAIGEFEKTAKFNRFTSKYDFYLAGKTKLNKSESRGEALFNGKAQCNACHITDMGTTPDGRAFPPVLTDFSFDNLGLPRNISISGNPAPNQGLAGNATVIADGRAELERGKHKVMSLRNIAVTAPYMHNGVLLTLEDVVHFYNTRDTLAQGGTNESSSFGVTTWPAPEVPSNVNTSELGNLGLTAREEKDIVNFMKTFTDRWKGKKTSPWSADVGSTIAAIHAND